MLRKIILLLALCASSSFSGDAFAVSGIFGSGVELNINGTLTLYALDDGGTTRLKPLASSATLDETSWANGSEAAPILNLGTFDPSLGNSLILTGGSLLTFKNGMTSNVTAAFLDFRVFQVTPAGSFTEFSLAFNEDNVSGGAGDQRWASETQTINLLNALPNGTYTLGVFLRENSTDGGAFSSNGGANYGATFTVVPEPSSLALIAGSSVLCALMFLRRRRA